MQTMTSRSETRPLTYREALAIARARQPKVCPACGSEKIAPLFLDEADDQWDCSDCGAWWSPA